MGRPGRPSKKRLQKLYSTTVRLVRYTTWKCGRIERAIINYLRMKLSRSGEAKATVKEILQVSPVREKTFDALRRLQNRRIVKIGDSEIIS